MIILGHANDNVMTKEAVEASFASTDAAFLSFLESEYPHDESVSFNGSNCLVGYLSEGILRVANVGDSRAVLGYLDSRNHIIFKQLSLDHLGVTNNIVDDPNIGISTVGLYTPGVWRVKGKDLITKSIGHFYLKDPKYSSIDPLLSRATTSVPSVHRHILRPNDQFVIFASSTFWTCISYYEAVEIVHLNGRKGGAKKLVEEVSKKLQVLNSSPMRGYSKLRSLHFLGMTCRPRRSDFSVVIVYFDHPRSNKRPLEVEVEVEVHTQNKMLKVCSDTAGQSGDAMAVDCSDTAGQSGDAMAVD